MRAVLEHIQKARSRYETGWWQIAIFVGLSGRRGCCTSVLTTATAATETYRFALPGCRARASNSLKLCRFLVWRRFVLLDCGILRNTQLRGEDPIPFIAMGQHGSHYTVKDEGVLRRALRANFIARRTKA